VVIKFLSSNFASYDQPWQRSALSGRFLLFQCIMVIFCWPLWQNITKDNKWIKNKFYATYFFR